MVWIGLQIEQASNTLYKSTQQQTEEMSIVGFGQYGEDEGSHRELGPEVYEDHNLNIVLHDNVLQAVCFSDHIGESEKQMIVRHKPK